MQVILDFLKSVGLFIVELFGITYLPFDVLYLGIGVLVLALIILIVLIVVIVKCAKRSKRKKANKKAQVVTQEKPVEEKVDVSKNEQEVVKEEAVDQTVLEKTQPENVEVDTQVEEKVALETVEEKVEVQEEQTEEKPIETVKEKVAKKATVKKKVEEKTDAEKPKTTKKLTGKWTVEIKSAGEYDSKLSASNGEVMLTSEIYTSEEGARNGIASILRGVENGKFVIYQDKNGNYYYKLKSANNRLLCVGEIYKSKEQCLKAVESVKRIASVSPIANGLVEGSKYVEYTPSELDLQSKTSKGKWRIEQSEDGEFSARLYANNGQLMLATEKVALLKSAKNAIESVKKNAEAGNFIIDKDKFGRFYYKLRNAQKSVICIGEAYDKLDSCISAIESVRRFALNSAVVSSEK